MSERETGLTGRGALAAVAIVALVLVSVYTRPWQRFDLFGVPTDESPQIIPFDQLGSELSELGVSALATPTPEPTTELLLGTAVMYFVNQENLLQPEQRDVVLLPVEERAKPILEALIEGPDEEERSLLGLSTGLRNDITINSVEITVAGLAIVDIQAGTIEELRGDNLRIALAQIVFTLTDLQGIESVRLRIDGEDRPLATGDGGVTDPLAPVTRTDYAIYQPGPGLSEPTPTPDPSSLPATSPDGQLLPTPDPDPEPTATPLPGTPLPDPIEEPTVAETDEADG